MDTYSHLTKSSLDEMTTEQLNYLVNHLSLKSRERYEQERLNRRLEGKSPRPDCDAELGINTNAPRSL